MLVFFGAMVRTRLIWEQYVSKPCVGHILRIQPPVRCVQVCYDFQAVLGRNRANFGAFSVVIIDVRYGTVHYYGQPPMNR